MAEASKTQKDNIFYECCSRHAMATEVLKCSECKKKYHFACVKTSNCQNYKDLTLLNSGVPILFACVLVLTTLILLFVFRLDLSLKVTVSMISTGISPIEINEKMSLSDSDTYHYTI
ncbi:jg27285 [Pararge aegeria aegeria]|uniref:Jg27285 protein n=1 Tax=Pararge aegeria aegeria TaxID=348720 RepID=A0A8S4QKJ8_9NEOP|nr:jg27285 [Pararge aegeria aegeria]